LASEQKEIETRILILSALFDDDDVNAKQEVVCIKKEEQKYGPLSRCKCFSPSTDDDDDE